MSNQEQVVYIRLIPVIDMETGDVKEINRDNILMIYSIDKNGPVCKTSDKKIYRLAVRTRLSDLEEAWFNDGFRLFDISNVVNINHVKLYDEEYGKLYFEENPTKDSDFASVARIHKEHAYALMSKYGFKSLKQIKVQEAANHKAQLAKTKATPSSPSYLRESCTQ